MEHAAGPSVSRTHVPTRTLQGEAASLPRFSELVRRGRQAEERMKLWEQAYEREQGAPATVEAKQASTTYTALQTRHKLAAAQLQELLLLAPAPT